MAPIPDNQQEITRLGLTLDNTNKNVEQLLKLVRDGNGTAPLITRVQTVESELKNLVESNEDIKDRLVRFEEKLETQERNSSDQRNEMSLLRQELHAFVETFNEQQKYRRESQMTKNQAVYGMLLTILASVAASWLAAHGIGAPVSAEPSHGNQKAIELPAAGH